MSNATETIAPRATAVLPCLDCGQTLPMLGVGVLCDPCLAARTERQRARFAREDAAIAEDPRLAYDGPVDGDGNPYHPPGWNLDGDEL